MTLFARPVRSVATITAGLREMAEDLADHEQASLDAATDHREQASEHHATADGHEQEANRAKRVAEKIRELIG